MFRIIRLSAACATASARRTLSSRPPPRPPPPRPPRPSSRPPPRSLPPRDATRVKVSDRGEARVGGESSRGPRQQKPPNNNSGPNRPWYASKQRSRPLPSPPKPALSSSEPLPPPQKPAPSSSLPPPPAGDNSSILLHRRGNCSAANLAARLRMKLHVITATLKGLDQEVKSVNANSISPDVAGECRQPPLRPASHHHHP